MKKTDQYITFARKYRPNNFSELYGQEVLVKVLNYTIINNRISQGYLLTGTRGVGKTTSARIIAKTINCTNPIIENNSIFFCENCQNCLSFINNKHPDIIEVDAASKTSVDDIRRIIESSEYKPLIGKYSVYIIDEVHMLSKGAFNALLKILEEPPEHIIFIFATTEPQKIPLTVISRCQRYDLKRLTPDKIFQLLEEIGQKEQLKIEPQALKVIASRSDGSARDAIAVLDQATGLGEGGVITSQIVYQVLGLVDTSNIIKFFEYISQKSVDKAIGLVNELYIASANLEIFIASVADFIAHLNKVKLLTDYQDPVYESFDHEIKNILSQTELSQLSIIWQIYSKGVIEVKASHNQLIETEMLIIKSIYCQMLPNPEELASIVYSDDNQLQPLSQNDKIIDFLTYLHNNKELEIYYLLLNQVELKKFDTSTLEIAGQNISTKIKDQLAHLLFAWTGQTWNVIITKQLEVVTMKGQMIDKVKSSQDWEILTKHFPDLTITDILLNK